MIHGVSSTGPWYSDLRAVLSPFLHCEGVHYRAYHSFGAIKVFFWPWALWLGMVLIAYGMSVPLDLPIVGDARALIPWLLLAAGVVEGIRTRGVTRGVPWALAAAWSLTCFLGWWRPQLVLHALLAFATAWIVWSELDWEQPRRAKIRAVTMTIGVAVAGWLLWWLRVPGGVLPLWAALTVQMALLELRESGEGNQITAMWRGAMIVACPILGIGAGIVIDLYPAWALLIALALLIIGHIEPYRRVWRTLESVQAGITNARRGFRGQTHLISHSLGTFLSGRSFQGHYPGQQWDRVVFVGGVISEVYDWAMVLNAQNSLSRVQDVRNEHGGLDVVVRATGYGGRWARDQELGTAGWRGLRPAPPFVVHDVPDPYNVCPQCPPSPPRTRLHNFHFPGYMHSTYFFNRTHMRAFWLPYFLGHVPSQYAYFLKLCTTGAELLRANRLADFHDDVAAELRSTGWNWDQRGGRLLDAAVRRHLGALLTDLDAQFPKRIPRPSDEILESVPRLLCQLVDRAIEAQEAGTGPDALVKMLNPPDTIPQVAEAALQDARQKLGRP